MDLNSIINDVLNYKVKDVDENDLREISKKHKSIFKDLTSPNTILQTEYIDRINEDQQGYNFLKNIWMSNDPNTSLTLNNKETIDIVLELLERTNDIKGDVIEAGCWRGGQSIIFKKYLESNNVDKEVYAADSFKGLPVDPTKESDQIVNKILDPIGRFGISRKDVQSYFDYFNADIKVLEGWFKDTLHDINDLSFIYLDGDFYESTLEGLSILYPKLQKGGIIIIDDYNLPMGCKEAVDQYRSENNITESIERINDQSVYWTK